VIGLTEFSIPNLRVPGKLELVNLPACGGPGGGGQAPKGRLSEESCHSHQGLSRGENPSDLAIMQSPWPCLPW